VAPRRSGNLGFIRAAVPREGEIVLESNAERGERSILREWQRAEETKSARHFFPWWYEDSYSKTIRRRI